MDHDQIRELLHQARLDRGWSMEQVARRAGVTRQTINNWEKGRFRPANEQIGQWAAALGWRASFVAVPDSGWPLLQAAATLEPADQILAAALVDILPHLDAADRRTLQLLVDGWSQSFGLAADPGAGTPYRAAASRGR